MKAKIFMLVMLMSLSAVLIAQPAELVPKKQGMQQKEQTMQQRKAVMQKKMAAMHQMKGAANGLNLTEAQRTSFKEGMIAVQKQLQPLRNQLREAEAHQKTLVTTEKPDLGAINKNIERIGDLRIQMAKVQAKQHLDMRAQLTDEQRLKFDLFREKMAQGKGKKSHMKGQKPQRMRPGMR